MRLMLLFSAFCCLVFAGFGQDTLGLVRLPDGAKSFRLATRTDTSFVSLYPDGRREGVISVKNGQLNGTYSRWYENGKLMWQKEMRNGKEQGKSVFYDRKGQKIVEVLFEDGQKKSLVWVQPGKHFVLGKITWSSTVVGGVEREDGTSHVSESSGAFSDFRMYGALVDSLRKPVLISGFKSDFKGDFVLVVPAGKIGFFPASTEIGLLEPGDYKAPAEDHFSGDGAWTQQGPLQVLAKDRIIEIELHHSSTGYAN